MAKTKILFIGFQDLVHPCYDDFLEAIGAEYDVSLYDSHLPVADQMRDVRAVVDQGGWGSHEMVDAAVAAGAKLWQVIGTGLDHLDVSYILQSRIPLANTPGIFSGIALAEHAIFLMLCFAKNICLSTNNIRSGVFLHPMNDELEGKTLGLVGLGASGRELAKRANALGMRIMAVDAVEVPPSVLEECHIEFFASSQELGTLLPRADYLSLHTPLTSKTRHLVDERALGCMKRTAVLVNVARGELVEEKALIDALRSGTIRGACLDTFAHEPLDPAHPLLHMENVVATPHIAGGTRGTLRRRTQAAAENIFRIVQGVPILHQVTSIE
jgi:D-3-phosphoglycerate dehydrogenase / 2-oxoglutarate reductase